jgi:signal transduction histidine kinase/CheY-like chemotaxis protein
MPIDRSWIRRARLAATTLGVGALLAVSIMVALFNEAEHGAEEASAARVQARVLAQTIPAALSFGDRASLGDYVAALRANPNVAAVGIFDQSGRRVAHAGAMAMPADLSLVPSRFQGALRVVEPVVAKNARLGTVVLMYRTETLGGRAMRYLGSGLLLIMATLLFVLISLDSRALTRANAALAATNDELRLEIEERQRAEAALRQSQKMESIGRLTGGIAHDFNNMLAIVAGSLDLVLRRAGDADPRMIRLVEAAMEGARRAAALTQRLLAFSRRQPLNPSPADINKVMADTAEMLRRTLGEAIIVETVSGAGLWAAHVDVPQLESALVNLGINARDAMPDGGRLTLETSNTYLDRAYAAGEAEVEPGQYVMIAITDSGTGMPPEVLSQVFEPFFTTKPPGQGTGLGLSQVHGFIKQSAGHIRIYSELGVGTTVKLYLPRSDAAAAETSIGRAAAKRGERRAVTVLVVEDEAGVRGFVVEALSELGYDVIAADGAQSALQRLAEHPEISILLTDVVMPNINGRQLADQALRLRPSLRVIFMTGYTRNAIVHNGVLDRNVRLITKPFSVAVLEAELNAVVEGRT